MAKETEYKEELFNNHGKPISYFKVPQLATRTRSNSRRFHKLVGKIEEDKNELARKEAEKSRSIGRNSKFALNSDHENLKRMIAKRE